MATPRPKYAAVLFDLLSGLLDSWTLWDSVAGSEAAGRTWRAAYLRRYTYAFIQMFASHLTPELVDKARQAKGETYDI